MPKAVKRGRPCIYPWDTWLRKGRTIVLEKGKDFHCETQSLTLLARRQLERRKLKGVVRVRDLFVVLEVL